MTPKGWKFEERLDSILTDDEPYAEKYSRLQRLAQNMLDEIYLLEKYLP